MFNNMMRSKKKEAQAAGSTETTAPVIFDVTAETFEDKVMTASRTVPVLVDFWAPWCGPCKQMMPVIEQAVQAAGGKVRLAKVNIDDNPELAQALRVQSVPAVFAFFQGQPITGFTGSKPASQIQELIRQLVEMARQNQPESLNIAEVLVEAAQALAARDLTQAQQLYSAILQEDQNNAQAYAGLVRTFIAAGMTEQARQMVDNAPESMIKDAAFEAARSALELAETAPAGKPEELAARMEKTPDDHATRYDLAMSLFATGQAEAAIDQLLEIMRRDRGWEDEKARKQLLKFFEALGPSAPETVAGRRKLSGLLFS